MKLIRLNKTKSFLIIIICVISVPFFAQNCDKGCCNLIKTAPDNSIPAGKAKLHIFFSGPDKKPVKSRSVSATPPSKNPKRRYPIRKNSQAWIGNLGCRSGHRNREPVVRWRWCPNSYSRRCRMRTHGSSRSSRRSVPCE